MTVWVGAGEILAGAGNDSPSAADSEWSAVCADAVNAGIDLRLDGALFLTPPVEPPVLPPEILLAARYAGVEAYKRREAAFGLTGYVDLQGAAVRVARDYLEAIAPILARYATVGIA